MKHIALSLIFFATLSEAQVYNCNGVMTNTPCEDGILIATPKPPPTEEDIQKVERAKKETLLLELNNQRGRAIRDHKIDFSIGDTESVCQTSTYEECANSVRARQKELDERVLLKLKIENETKLANPTPTPELTAQDQKVIIIDNRDTFIKLPRLRPGSSHWYAWCRALDPISAKRQGCYDYQRPFYPPTHSSKPPYKPSHPQRPERPPHFPPKKIAKDKTIPPNLPDKIK